MATLIKIDRNGSKHWKGMVTCDRCEGRGWYAIGSHNGQLVPSHVDNAVCYKCNGTGKVMSKWIERTPEYQAKLDARRKAKQDAWEAKQKAEHERIRKEEEALRLAEEARIKAQKAISQYVGEIGQRITVKGTFVKTTWFKVQSFSGFGEDIMYIHTFKDADGNVLVWKTGRGLGDIDLRYGEMVEINGTVKQHSEYKDEKQAVLIRCKVTKM